MISEQWEQKLIADGYSYVNTRIDPPGTTYGDNEHPVDTVHVVLTGAMDLRLKGKSHTLVAGDRVDIPKHVVHSTVIGPGGCTFLTGINI